MKEWQKSIFSSSLLDAGRATVLEPSGTIGNNLQIRALLCGLTGSTSYSSIFSYEGVGDDTYTKFKDPELCKRLESVVKAFFYKEVAANTEISGGTSGTEANLKVVSKDIILETLGDSPITMTPVYVAGDKVPTQFFISSENLRLDVDPDSDVKLESKDIMFIYPQPHGFLISMSYEEYGAFVSCFSDVLAVGRQKKFSEKALLLMKPTAKESMYTAFASYYRYMFEKKILETSYYKF